MLIAITLLAGCASREGPFPDTIGTPSPVSDTFDREEALAGRETPAPTPAVGRAWTYEGVEFYNEDTAFTVVVSDATAEGYQFAGGAEDDLVYPALWGSWWYGPHDRSLNRVDHDRPLLRFPLRDGASWPFSDTITFVARAFPVDTPAGRDEGGYVIEGGDEHRAIHVEYSPRAQNIVRLTITRADGTTRDDLRMTRVADNASWVWFELGPLTVVPNAHEPGIVEVPEGFDNVLVSAGGTQGSRARVEGPGGTSWSAEFPDVEVWKQTMLPPAAGKWVGVLAERPSVEGAPALPVESPIGWAYMHIAPVRWMRSS